MPLIDSTLAIGLIIVAIIAILIFFIWKRAEDKKTDKKIRRQAIQIHKLRSR